MTPKTPPNQNTQRGRSGKARKAPGDAIRDLVRRPHVFEMIVINGPHALASALAGLPVMSEIRAEPVRQELTDAEFMMQLSIELQHATNLSDEQIAAYTEDEHAWLAYKADGYSPLEAVEADMEHWD